MTLYHEIENECERLANCPDTAENAKLGITFRAVWWRQIKQEIKNQSREIKQLRMALEEIRVYAKKLRKSSELIGPPQYQDDPTAMRIWQRSVYHEGKTIEGMVKAALRGKKLFEPDNYTHDEAIFLTGVQR